jgi:sulfoacetaldehyde acetyltransferase
VGTELDTGVSYARIADSCGLIGIQVDNMDSLRDSLDTAIKAQMNEGKTTFIEVILNQELGEPFRRDAMKKPVSVAGINPSDMRPQ